MVSGSLGVQSQDESEAGWQAVGYVDPTVALGVAAEHAAVILLEEHVWPRRVGEKLICTLAELWEPVRQEVGANARVHGTPGSSAVDGSEHADGRYADPHLVQVRRVQHHAVKTKPSKSGRPLISAGMVGQPGYLPPSGRAVFAFEKGGGLDPGV